MMKYCSKHGEHELHRVEQVPYLMEGLKAVVGSEDRHPGSQGLFADLLPGGAADARWQMLDAYLELGDWHCR